MAKSRADRTTKKNTLTIGESSRNLELALTANNATIIDAVTSTLEEALKKPHNLSLEQRETVLETLWDTAILSFDTKHYETCQNACKACHKLIGKDLHPEMIFAISYLGSLCDCKAQNVEHAEKIAESVFQEFKDSTNHYIQLIKNVLVQKRKAHLDGLESETAEEKDTDYIKTSAQHGRENNYLQAITILEVGIKKIETNAAVDKDNLIDHYLHLLMYVIHQKDQEKISKCADKLLTLVDNRTNPNWRQRILTALHHAAQFYVQIGEHAIFTSLYTRTLALSETLELRPSCEERFDFLVEICKSKTTTSDKLESIKLFMLAHKKRLEIVEKLKLNTDTYRSTSQIVNSNIEKLFFEHLQPYVDELLGDSETRKKCNQPFFIEYVQLLLKEYNGKKKNQDGYYKNAIKEFQETAAPDSADKKFIDELLAAAKFKIEHGSVKQNKSLAKEYESTWKNLWSAASPDNQFKIELYKYITSSTDYFDEFHRELEHLAEKSDYAKNLLSAIELKNRLALDKAKRDKIAQKKATATAAYTPPPVPQPADAIFPEEEKKAEKEAPPLPAPAPQAAPKKAFSCKKAKEYIVRPTPHVKLIFDTLKEKPIFLVGNFITDQMLNTKPNKIHFYTTCSPQEVEKFLTKLNELQTKYDIKIQKNKVIITPKESLFATESSAVTRTNCYPIEITTDLDFSLSKYGSIEKMAEAYATKSCKYTTGAFIACRKEGPLELDVYDATGQGEADFETRTIQSIIEPTTAIDILTLISAAARIGFKISEKDIAAIQKLSHAALMTERDRNPSAINAILEETFSQEHLKSSLLAMRDEKHSGINCLGLLFHTLNKSIQKEKNYEKSWFAHAINETNGLRTNLSYVYFIFIAQICKSTEKRQFEAEIKKNPLYKTHFATLNFDEFYEENIKKINASQKTWRDKTSTRALIHRGSVANAAAGGSDPSTTPASQLPQPKNHPL